MLIGFSFFLVGITGLEPATSRPPDVCATNCAKSRSFKLLFSAFAGAKVAYFYESAKYFFLFFLFFIVLTFLLLSV